MKALNVHAPSALVTPFRSITPRQQRRKSLNAAGAALRLCLVANRSDGCRRGEGAGCANGRDWRGQFGCRGDDAGARVDPADAGEARMRAVAV